MSLKIIHKFVILFIFTLSIIYCQDTTSFYPLQTGNKWIYNDSTIIEIVSDTIINGNKYYKESRKVKYYGEGYNYIRYSEVDSSVYRFIDNNEIKIWTFGELHDSLMSSYFFKGFGDIYYFSTNRRYCEFYYEGSLIVYYADIRFVSGIGKTYESISGHDDGYSSTKLIGCIINNKQYGNITDIGENKIEKFSLNITNYPNPFNNSTTIKYSIPNPSLVNISVFDLQGRKIEALLYKKLTQGNYQFNWNTNDLCSGIYFIKIESDNSYKVRKCNLIK